MENIILIGMPGSGKSTIGVVLAKVLGYEFMDSDLVIQKEEKRLLSEIISQEGIDGFIRIEDRVNAGLDVYHTVVATGGSAVYGEQAMKHLKEIGTILYLKLGYEELCGRLGDLTDRGVVLREGQTLQDLYLERVPLYEKYADYVIDEQNKDIRTTLQIIKDRLKK